MIELRDKKGGRVLGLITPAQLQFLVDHLEEESAADTDYHVSKATVENEQLRGMGSVRRVMTSVRRERILALVPR